MKRHLPIWVLGLAVFGCAGLSWFVAGATAEDEINLLIDGVNGVELTMPEAIPAGFNVEADALATISPADGVTLSVEAGRDGKFKLVGSNSGTEARRFKLRLQAFTHSGERFARMIPPPTLVWSDELEITLAPGQDLEEALAYAAKKIDLGPEAHIFESVEFQLTDITG